MALLEEKSATEPKLNAKAALAPAPEPSSGSDTDASTCDTRLSTNVTGVRQECAILRCLSWVGASTKKGTQLSESDSCGKTLNIESTIHNTRHPLMMMCTYVCTIHVACTLKQLTEEGGKLHYEGIHLACTGRTSESEAKSAIRPV